MIYGKLLNAGYKTGLTNQVRHIWGASRLTVLAYHRIVDYRQAAFDMFVPNVSATPAMFAEQMDFVAQHFNVVSLAELHHWLAEKRPLPPNPLLLTFDDGYRDNLQHAFPILKQYNFPATIFLATNYIGKKKPFFWDLVAYCFHHTKKETVNLAHMGQQHWTNQAEQIVVTKRWLEVLKHLPNDEKETAVRQLPQQLEVTLSENAFDGICLTWDEVRTMFKSNLITFGAHTQNHPILTRILIEEAAHEIIGSQARIEAEIGSKIDTFAYPNGQASDFNSRLMNILQKNGFTSAFTLIAGPAKAKEVHQTPLAIRRIFLGHKDTMPRFAAKVMGVLRLRNM